MHEVVSALAHDVTQRNYQRVQDNVEERRDRFCLAGGKKKEREEAAGRKNRWEKEVKK